ncbi:MAG: hypothetical protein Q8K38_02025 [Burkholderiaceae bacterium]|nr:hypothetical protein [Burkholderiaceae bacterium]MDZ4144553.1 hypothetical protein [Burkholderiales bacterium]
MELSALILQYGLWAVFLAVFMEQLGFPLPTLPLLLVVGAAAATSPGFGIAALGVTMVASVVGGAVMFVAGRKYGQSILGFFCRISLTPSACVDIGLAALDRVGPLALVMARFMPGLSAMAPALAGKAGMPLRVFLVSQGVAAALFAATGIGVGRAFHDTIEPLVRGLDAYARPIGLALALAIGAWLAYVVLVKRRRRVL